MTNLVALNFRLKFPPLWTIGLKHISVCSESIPDKRYFLDSSAVSILSAILECLTRYMCKNMQITIQYRKTKQGICRYFAWGTKFIVKEIQWESSSSLHQPLLSHKNLWQANHKCYFIANLLVYWPPYLFLINYFHDLVFKIFAKYIWGNKRCFLKKRKRKKNYTCVNVCQLNFSKYTAKWLGLGLCTWQILLW